MILEEDDSGTINVAIRIRPLSNSEKERGDVAAWNVSEDRDKIIASDALKEYIEKEGENNKKIHRVKSKKTLEQESTSLEEAETLHGEEAYVDLEEVKNDLIITDKISINEKNELDSTEIQDVEEDPRRKRRRSSASS